MRSTLNVFKYIHFDIYLFPFHSCLFIFVRMHVSALDLCRRRVLGISLPQTPIHFTANEITMYMTSLIPIDNQMMVCIDFV